MAISGKNKNGLARDKSFLKVSLEVTTCKTELTPHGGGTLAAQSQYPLNSS